MVLAPELPRTGDEGGRPSAHARRTVGHSSMSRFAVATGTVGVAFIVGHDGSTGWRFVRLAAVAALAVTTTRAAATRPLLRFCAGLLLLAAGVGIALPHLAKQGPGLLAAAGAGCLFAGLLSSVSGAAAILRGRSAWGRAATMPVLFAAVFVALWTVAQAVAATNVPRTEVGATNPADLGLDHADVELPSRDGVVLSGWYLPPTNGAAVVLLHGAGSTRSAVLEHAAVLARNGFGVLLFDARGHGRSEGRAMDFGWYGDLDVDAAVSFLERQPDVSPDRIAAVGLSMGGEEAIGAAATDPRIQAVVAEGATNRMAGDKAWLSDAHGALGWIQERVDWVTYALTDLLTDTDPPIALRDAVAASERPTLLIAAGDVPDEADAGRFIRSGAPETVELWVVADTGHTDGLRTHPVEWEQRVVAFLTSALGTR